MKIFVYIMMAVGIVNCSDKNIIDKNSTNIEIDGYFKHETSGTKHIFSIKNDILIVHSVKNATSTEKGNAYKLTQQTIEMLNDFPKGLLHKNKTLGKGYYGRYYIFTFHNNTKYSSWEIDVMYKFTNTDEHKDYLNFLKTLLQNANYKNKLKELKIIKPEL